MKVLFHLMALFKKVRNSLPLDTAMTTCLDSFKMVSCKFMETRLGWLDGTFVSTDSISWTAYLGRREEAEEEGHGPLVLLVWVPVSIAGKTRTFD